MKFGPVHLIRHGTFRRLHELQDLWHQFSSQLAAAAGSNPLADEVLDQTHGLMHSPLSAAHAETTVPDVPPVTAADIAAAERVIVAYRNAKHDAAAPPTASMWDRITREKQDFLTALEAGDAAVTAGFLAAMFRTDLTWGLGQVHSSHPALLREKTSHLHFRFTDTLVSLAEAVGAAGVTAMQQDPVAHLRPLNVDPNDVYRRTADRLGFSAAFPAVGGLYGFVVSGETLTIDGLTHAYVAYRLRELGAGSTSTAYELGGGYGGLALMATRAGVGRYTIFDLPWVNALQGYFLIRTLGPAAVHLYGESAAAPVRVLPYWALYAEPAGACDVFVNSDSLPEMGRATAAEYLPHIRRVTKGPFLSINQEAGATVPGVGPQNCVRQLVEECGGFRKLGRQRHWLRQGYVEEVFAVA